MYQLLGSFPYIFHSSNYPVELFPLSWDSLLLSINNKVKDMVNGQLCSRGILLLQLMYFTPSYIPQIIKDSQTYYSSVISSYLWL